MRATETQLVRVLRSRSLKKLTQKAVKRPYICLFRHLVRIERTLCIVCVCVCVCGAEEARADQVDVLLRDSYVMRGVSHDNVSCVVMTCLDQPPLVIYADVTGTAGNLKTFLQHCKMSEVGLVFRLR